MARITWIGTVCNVMDDLQRIRSKKMQDMMQRAKPEGPVPTRAPVELTDSNLDSTIGSTPLVVVDCWAAWCYPCRIIAPIVEELNREYSSVATFAKLNVDENPSTAMRYGIQSIPTILIIKNGIEVDRIIGAVPKGQIDTVLKKYL